MLVLVVRLVYLLFIIILKKNISGINLLGIGFLSFTVSKIECSKQAYAIEYISME